MAKKKPSHADAELVLRLYDLRREPVMRESRRTIAGWQPRSLEDIVAITKPDDPRNAAWRQVSSYFEMAFGFARHEVVPADFLAENTAEGLLLYAKIEPHLAAFRKQVSPTAFRNAEWLVKKSKVARERLALFQKRLAAGRAAEAKAAAEPARA
ncbi:MAG TPA: hypothetical protein VF530_00430 [Planctomycetota bacterium]